LRDYKPVLSSSNPILQKNPQQNLMSLEHRAKTSSTTTNSGQLTFVFQKQYQ
jgi:hypothetical protein